MCGTVVWQGFEHSNRIGHGLGFPGGSSLIHCADSWGAISWVLSLGAITMAPVALSAKVSVPHSCLPDKLSKKGDDKGQNPGTSPTHLQEGGR